MGRVQIAAALRRTFGPLLRLKHLPDARSTSVTVDDPLPHEYDRPTGDLRRPDRTRAGRLASDLTHDLGYAAVSRRLPSRRTRVEANSLADAGWPSRFLSMSATS